QFPTIQLQERHHRPIPPGIDELVGMPRRGEGPGLRLAVTHDARNDEIAVVERHAVGVGETVAKLAAFVDGTGRFRSNVAPDMAWERELLEELLHPFGIFAL